MKKFFVMFFVAASLLTVSCTKENDPNAITEANLVGEWGWPSNHEMKGSKIILNADHTGGGMPMSKFNWTLDGNKFVGLSVYGGYRLEMTIKSINGDKMEVEGQHQLIDNDGNVIRVEHTATGTLVKTITTQSPTLTTDLMVGTWNFDADDHLLRWDMTVNSDGIVEAMQTTENEYFVPQNTTVRVENGKVVEINRVYVP